MAGASGGEKRRQWLGDVSMAYVEVGSGDPIVFLHGNPTSSYLWRNVIPYVERLGRCLAPDLIGMGDSDKLSPSGPDRYRFAEHRAYLDAFLESLAVHERVTLVVHDWGSVLGFDWARRHPRAVRAIAYTEAIVGVPHLEELPEPARLVFEALRSDRGERMILADNLFVEQILPGAVLHPLTAATLDEYRRPFREPGEGRRPMLTWPREVPFDGAPVDVAAVAQANAEWLATSPVPKLFINAQPGLLMALPSWRERCHAFPNQREVTVAGLHFVPEDAPDEIGTALADWLREVIQVG
jgi:haloalkane dehalogenase